MFLGFLSTISLAILSCNMIANMYKLYLNDVMVEVQFLCFKLFSCPMTHVKPNHKTQNKTLLFHDIAFHNATFLIINLLVSDCNSLWTRAKLGLAL